METPAAAAAVAAPAPAPASTAPLTPEQLSELNAAAAAVKAAEARRKQDAYKARKAEIRSRTPKVRYGGTMRGNGNITLGTFPTVAEAERLQPASHRGFVVLRFV